MPTKKKTVTTKIAKPKAGARKVSRPSGLWMVKQEPEKYSWDDFVRDGRTDWTGVRNFQARNNLKQMKNGDRVLFYHSGTGKCVVGIAEVAKAALCHLRVAEVPTVLSPAGRSRSPHLRSWRDGWHLGHAQMA